MSTGNMEDAQWLCLALHVTAWFSITLHSGTDSSKWVTKGPFTKLPGPRNLDQAIKDD